jgi:outer membrane protein TolC
LERQRFNRKAELLRLVGLPVGADQVEFAGQLDSFGLGDFDMEAMVRLALAQSSEVALAETLVAEQDRALGQLRYEYLPDLRLVSGYQDDGGRAGATISNENDTWGLDVLGQPGMRSGTENAPRGVGLFAPDFGLPLLDSGWFAGAEVRLPLTEGGARTGRRIQVRADLRRLQAVAADQEDLVELAVRQSHKFLAEQRFQVDLAQENVNIERERFGIQEELRDAGKVTDDDLETFRRAFFVAQDNLFQQQETLIDQQEDLRLAIRYFKP